MADIKKNSSAGLSGALKMTALSFANIARPGDVFWFGGKRYVVESVSASLPVIIRTTDRVTLKPDADALIAWEGVGDS